MKYDRSTREYQLITTLLQCPVEKEFLEGPLAMTMEAVKLCKPKLVSKGQAFNIEFHGGQSFSTEGVAIGDVLKSVSEIEAGSLLQEVDYYVTDVRVPLGCVNLEDKCEHTLASRTITHPGLTKPIYIASCKVMKAGNELALKLFVPKENQLENANTLFLRVTAWAGSFQVYAGVPDDDPLALTQYLNEYGSRGAQDIVLRAMFDLVRTQAKEIYRSRNRFVEEEDALHVPPFHATSQAPVEKYLVIADEPLLVSHMDNDGIHGFSSTFKVGKVDLASIYAVVDIKGE